MRKLSSRCLVVQLVQSRECTWESFVYYICYKHCLYQIKTHGCKACLSPWYQLLQRINKKMRQVIFGILDRFREALLRHFSTFVVHIRGAAQLDVLSLNMPKLAKHICDAQVDHRLATRLLLPELYPAQRTSMLMPSSAAREGMVEIWWRCPQSFPESR